jgi:hypothetical protein
VPCIPYSVAAAADHASSAHNRGQLTKRAPYMRILNTTCTHVSTALGQLVRRVNEPRRRCKLRRDASCKDVFAVLAEADCRQPVYTMTSLDARRRQRRAVPRAV